MADWVTLVLVATGMVLVFAGTTPPQALAPNPGLGNLLGVFSGAMWAGTICGLRWLGKLGEGNAMAPVLLGNSLAVLICAPQMFPLPALPVGDIFALLYLGTIQIGLAYWCLTRAVARLSALEASLLIMIEPALNPVWTWLLHGERPAMLSIGGGGLILFSALLKSWRDRKNVLN